jgi:hypothetical protein
MEEQILEIIKEYWGSSQEGAARATTLIVMEFIEWIGFKEMYFTGHVWLGEWDEEREWQETWNSTIELFQYWFDKIKNKKP